MKSSRHSSRNRQGSLTVEVIVILPILIVATIAAFQFGSAMIVKQATVHAATVAAREAGKGADIVELEEVVNKMMQAHDLVVGADMTVILEDPEADLPVVSRGDLPCTPPEDPTLNPSEVRVTVCVSMTSRPFINALIHYCIDFTDRVLTASTVVPKETPEFP